MTQFTSPALFRHTIPAQDLRFARRNLRSVWNREISESSVVVAAKEFEALSLPWRSSMKKPILTTIGLALSLWLGMAVPASAQSALPISQQPAESSVGRKVFVNSKSLLVSSAVVEDKLLKRPEFKQLGFVITRDRADADIVLELRHDLLTKYVFSVIQVDTQTVLASGKLSSLGGTVAGKLAKRFVKDMSSVKGP